MAEKGAEIQITIDDAPGTANGAMRALLAEWRVKTMFFVEGEFVKSRPTEVAAMMRAGHRLGLHTWDHPQLTKMSDAKIREEFTKTDDLVKKLTGKSMAPHWRPPFGAFNQRVKNIANSLGFTKMWLWDVDSLDWKHLGHTQAIVNEVEGGLARVNKPTIDILFHDKLTTVNALKVLLPRLKAKGFRLVDFP
jgi:peptidoglycan/xylan/chitin deacetylase (PgdA/CDA1 family)